MLLTVLVGVTVAAFLGTRAVAHSIEALHRRQAAVSFEAAQLASRGGNAATAVAALRRAVLKDPENKRYRLALTEALAANRLDEEATRVLRALRDAQPEDPDTNLQLARLEARGTDADAARRYYQNALAGLWRPEQAEDRRLVRIELIGFLLAHEERARALSELLVLSATLPQDAGLQTHVGRMFLAAGDPRLALDHFVRAIRLDSESADALAGAGQAAFDLADYSRAFSFLNAAPRKDAGVAELRELARLVLLNDPLAPRLRARERHTRLVAGFLQAVHRLETCSSDPSQAAVASVEPLRREAQAFQSTLRLPPRQDARDVVDDGIDVVYRIERALAQSCQLPPAPLDRALLLIGRRHGFEDQ